MMVGQKPLLKSDKAKFIFKDKRDIILKITKKKRVRIIYKRDWVGTPYFR